MSNSETELQSEVQAPHFLVVWLATAFVVTSFLPYVAFSLGTSTNVSITSIIGGILSIRLARNPRIMIAILLTLTAPFAATLIRLAFDNRDVNVNSYFTYAFILFTFFGAASAFGILGRRCVKLLSVCISVSAVIAIGQKYIFLNSGVIPFIELYNVSGYASVASNADTIVRYIKRPFGLFPEPSFLAGSLALACGVLVLFMDKYKVPFKPFYATAFGLVIFTIFISDSGSGVICIALLGLSVFLPYLRKHKGLLFLLPFAMTGAVWLGLSIAANRQDGVNTSWNDRLASIIGALNLWLDNPLNFLVGVGRGLVPSYFLSGDVEYTGMAIYSVVPDVYSVIVRVIVENGALFGLPLLLWMLFLILRLGGRRMAVLGLALAGLWCVVAGLTISYETAAWIWCVPGACATIHFSNQINKERQNRVGYENSPRR